MSDQRPSRRKTHIAVERPPFERIALILQGGGALGSYQAGVYQALAEANLHPDWVAGISIGAVNSALIAGNPPERRVERLREFWETVSVSPFGMPNFPARPAFFNRVCRPRIFIRTAVPKPSATMMSPR
jgi:NTE family protein